MSVQYDIPIKNTSGETMPPFSVGEIQEVTAFDKDLAAEVKQPSDDSTGCVVVGPQVKVQDGKPGLGSLSFGVRVAFDDNSGEDTPAVGETWGGKDGSWKIHKDGTIGGFKILGDIQGGLVRVSPLGGGGGGGVEAVGAIAIITVDLPGWNLSINTGNLLADCDPNNPQGASIGQPPTSDNGAILLEMVQLEGPEKEVELRAKTKAVGNPPQCQLVRVPVINLSPTEFKAASVPRVHSGYTIKPTDGDTFFVIGWPDFSAAAEFNEAAVQAFFHESGNKAAIWGGKACDS